MEKAYKNIILISAVVSTIALIIFGDGWVSDSIWRTAFAYLTGFLIDTVLLSLAIGLSYFIIKRKGFPYQLILMFSILFTIFIFIMEATVWDVQVNYPIRQTIFESILFGTLYASLFFGIFSVIYYTINRIVKGIGSLLGVIK